MARKIRVRPGKGQSMLGFLVGLGFCGIGIFLVMPTMGVFGVLWTGMAAAITVMNGINAFSDRGVSSHEILIEEDRLDEIAEEPKGPDPADLRRDIELRLQAAEELYQAGTITKEEYEAKRQEILKAL